MLTLFTLIENKRERESESEIGEDEKRKKEGKKKDGREVIMGWDKIELGEVE